MLILCCPTLNRYEDCRKMIVSALEGSLKPDKIIIIDNGGTVETHLTGLPVDILRYKNADGVYYNLGVAASWNRFLKEYEADAYLIVNDDIVFGHDTIKDLYSAHQQNPDQLVYVTEGSGLNAFSCFLITPKALEEVGYFDEQFYPAYFEDNDYAYRLKLAGYDLFRVPTTIQEHVGSATMKSYTPEQVQKHHENFRANRKRYIDKWGGLPHHEVYTSPYNQ